MAGRKRLVVLGLAIALAVVGAQTANIAFSVIAVSILYGLWAVILRLIVPRSRYLGGIAVSILSVLPLAIGFVASWVGIYGVLLFAHGAWLSVTAAAQVDS